MHSNKKMSLKNVRDLSNWQHGQVHFRHIHEIAESLMEQVVFAVFDKIH